MFTIVGFMLAIIVAVGITIATIRQYLLRKIRKNVHQIYTTQQFSQTSELAVMVGLSTVELYWHWANIDSQVIAAADFSSTQDIHNGFEFAQYMSQHVADMDVKSLLGFKRRLMGYVGEQSVADLLIEQGHIVEVAQTANQPVWDLMVDGQAVNVKTVQDIASIKAQALAHPDTIYLVPEDAVGEVGNNIVRLDGFNYAELRQLTNQSVDESLDSTSTLMDIAGHLPVVPLLFSVIRNRKAIELGREKDIAVKHVILDTLGRGGGAGLGALIGGALGTAVGPVGTVIGSTLGIVAGGILGQNIADEIKQQPLQKALEKFEQQLQKFGATYANRLNRILHILQQPYMRQQQALQQLNKQFDLKKRQVRWWIFPDFYTVLLEETLLFANRQVDKQKIILAKIEVQLMGAHEQQDYRPLGLVMLNIPHMREILGTDLIALRHINEQRKRVYYERNQLYPEYFPSNGCL